MRRADFVDEHPNPREARHDASRRAGMIQVNVGQQQRPDIADRDALLTKALLERGQARGWPRIDQRHAIGIVNDRRRDRARSVLKVQIDEVGHVYRFRFVSNSLKMRLYSSAQLVASTKPWSSTGYTASSQFSFRSSISRCTSRTESWK